MLSNWGKSIGTILYERLTSPWWGTLLVTWSIINWKIIYLTIFVSSNEIEGNKIDFIIANYIDPWHLYGWPLIITVSLVGLFPFLEYYIYWLHLWFKERKYNKKIQVEKKQVLTIEKSAELRQEMADLTSKYSRIVDDKDNELKIRDTLIVELQKRVSELEEDETKKSPMSVATATDELPTFEKQKEYFDELAQLMKLPKISTSMRSILDVVQKTGSIPDSVDYEIKQYYLLNDIILEDYDGQLFLTDKGKYFYKKLLEQQFSKNQDLKP